MQHVPQENNIWLRLLYSPENTIQNDGITEMALLKTKVFLTHHKVNISLESDRCVPVSTYIDVNQCILTRQSFLLPHTASYTMLQQFTLTLHPLLQANWIGEKGLIHSSKYFEAKYEYCLANNFGVQNISELAALHSKSVRIKVGMPRYS